MQGDEFNGKDDTRFLSEGGPTLSSLAVDLSQQATDITVGTNCVYDDTDPDRWNVQHPACWELDIEANNTDSGYLFYYENAGDGVLLRMTAGPVIEAYVDGSIVASVTVSGVGGTYERLVVSWSMEANPFTTGASDAVRTELRVFNVTDETYFHDVQTHPAITSAEATAIWGASDTTGFDAYTGRMIRLRFSAGRFHPATEVWQDWAITVDQILGPNLASGEDSFSNSSATSSATYVEETDSVLLATVSEDIRWPVAYDITGNDITIACWIYQTDMSVNRRFLLLATAGATGALFMDVFTTGNVRVWWEHDGGGSVDMQRTTGTGYISANTWHHVAARSDGSATAANWSIFVDGVEATSYVTTINGAGTARATGGDWGFGWWLLAAFANSWVGYIADPRAWQRQLSDDEIAHVARDSILGTELQRRLEVPVPTQGSGVGAHDHLTGPVYQSTGAGLLQVDLRMAGHLVSELYVEQVDLDPSFPAARSADDPDGDGFTLLGQYLRHRPIPRAVNRLKVTVHLQCWRTDANAADTVTVRCYSLNRPIEGLANVPDPEVPLVSFYRAISRTTNDGSGTTGGALYEFDLLEVSRDPSGEGTYLCLAFAVTDAGGAGSTTAQRWRVRSWSVEPGVEETAGDLPLGFGG